MVGEQRISKVILWRNEMKVKINEYYFSELMFKLMRIEAERQVLLFLIILSLHEFISIFQSLIFHI